MARLIDADALRLMKTEECAGHSIEYAMGWKACIEYIKAVPTIDAIPVEWLREKMREPQMTCANPFGFVLAEWLEEQEAR